MTNDPHKEIRDEFRKIGSAVFQAGLNNTHSGNMSLRVGDRIFITRRGSMLGFLDDEDIVETGLLEDDCGVALASSEVEIHRAVLRHTSALSMIHTHPLSAVPLTFKYDELVVIDTEGTYYLKKIPVVAFKTASASREMIEELPKWLSRYPTILVRGHGAFSVGQTLEQALNFAHLTENSAEILYRTELLGIDPKSLQKEDYGDW